MRQLIQMMINVLSAPKNGEFVIYKRTKSQIYQSFTTLSRQHVAAKPLPIHR